MLKEAPLFSLANEKFNVIILAAGLGSRLRPETDYIPKALVQLGEERAIDYFIRKYQHISGRMILAIGYCADLLENYCRGKYPSLDLFFSRENVAELRGPGTSLLYALDQASSRLPTLVSFCDYLIEDQFSVESDCVCVSRPGDPDAVLDTYKALARVSNGIVTDLVQNSDRETLKENGFTGIFVCRDTRLLKSIVYTAASSGGAGDDIDYTFQIVRPYVARVRTAACPLSRMFEFGTENSLRRTKRYIDGNHDVHREPV